MIKRIPNEYQPKIIERALKKISNSWFQAVKKRLTSFQEFGVCFRQAYMTQEKIDRSMDIWKAQKYKEGSFLNYFCLRVSESNKFVSPYTESQRNRVIMNQLPRDIQIAMIGRDLANTQELVEALTRAYETRIKDNTCLQKYYQSKPNYREERRDNYNGSYEKYKQASQLKSNTNNNTQNKYKQNHQYAREKPKTLKKKPNSWFQAVKKRLTSFQEFGVCFRQAYMTQEKIDSSIDFWKAQKYKEGSLLNYFYLRVSESNKFMPPYTESQRNRVIMNQLPHRYDWKGSANTQELVEDLTRADETRIKDNTCSQKYYQSKPDYREERRDNYNGSYEMYKQASQLKSNTNNNTQNKYKQNHQYAREKPKSYESYNNKEINSRSSRPNPNNNTLTNVATIEVNRDQLSETFEAIETVVEIHSEAQAEDFNDSENESATRE
ncbi:hypothetical protein TSAR_016670 [Trichomalopsis sarcophagae]|uniref:Uncharacterized protein n=1 Tax=Trichomalopsis sarcophagae TaxID=543379 RepID=A0A232EDK0_9HYME|nr:hypothetical protein TSAR_016670 [Trichomalopsis sarcophagae]